MKMAMERDRLSQFNFVVYENLILENIINFLFLTSLRVLNACFIHSDRRDEMSPFDSLQGRISIIKTLFCLL